MAMPVAAFSKILRKCSSLPMLATAGPRCSCVLSVESTSAPGIADAPGGLGALTRCRAGLVFPGPFVVRFFAAIAGPLCTVVERDVATVGSADEHQTTAGWLLRNPVLRQCDCNVVSAA